MKSIEKKVDNVISLHKKRSRRGIGMRKRTAIGIFVVLGIALSLTAGAALLSYYGQVRATLDVKQSVTLDGMSYSGNYNTITAKDELGDDTFWIGTENGGTSHLISILGGCHYLSLDADYPTSLGNVDVTMHTGGSIATDVYGECDAGATVTIPDYVAPTCVITVGPGLTYTTIQAAINSVTAPGSGEVICVEPGTYAEQVVIDKSITLASTDGTATIDVSSFAGSSKTITDTQGSHGEVAGVYVTAPGVTIEGFHFVGIAPDSTTDQLDSELNTVIRVYTSADDLVVRNCIFDPPSGSVGRVAITVKYADNLLFENNEVNDYIYGVNLVDTDSIDNVIVQGNIFSQTQYRAGVAGGTYDFAEGVQLWLGDNLQVINNIFTGPGTSTGTGNLPSMVAISDYNNYFDSGGTKTITVERNTIENYYNGIDTCSNGLIRENIIRNNAIGVYVEDVSGIAPIINCNNIEGNSYDVSNDATVTIDATDNWWGCNGIQVSGNVITTWHTWTDGGTITLQPGQTKHFIVHYLYTGDKSDIGGTATGWVQFV